MALQDTKVARVLEILQILMRHPSRSFTIKDILHLSEVEATPSESRNVSRALEDIVSVGFAEKQEGKPAYYKCKLQGASKFVLPEDKDVVMNLIFLDKIKVLYPDVAASLDEFLENTLEHLPLSSQNLYNALKGCMQRNILYLGKSEYLEESADKIAVVMQAIQESCKIEVEYLDRLESKTKKKRVPLLIVVDKGETFVVCQRQGEHKDVYTLKLARIKSVRKLTEHFKRDEAFVQDCRKRFLQANSIWTSRDGEMEEVRIQFPAWCRHQLEEKPFGNIVNFTGNGAKPKITISKDGETLVYSFKAVVKDNRGLLQSLGCQLDLASVIKPKSLKDEMAKIASHWLDG